MDRRTYRRADRHLRPTLLGRLGGVPDDSASVNNRMWSTCFCKDTHLLPEILATVKRVSIHDNRSPTAHRQATSDILQQTQKPTLSGTVLQYHLARKTSRTLHHTQYSKLLNY